MPKLLTLGQCADKDIDLEVLCTGCLRRKIVAAKMLVTRFNPDLFPPNLNGRLKCAICSSTRCAVTAIPT